MGQPPEHKEPSRHWYSLAEAPDDEPDSAQAVRRGKARERMRRRREDQMLPAVNWSWGVIAVAVVGVIGLISLIALLATSSQAAPQIATSVPSALKTYTPPTPGVAVRP